MIFNICVLLLKKFQISQGFEGILRFDYITLLLLIIIRVTIYFYPLKSHDIQQISKSN